MDIIEALKLIVAKSPRAAENAIRAIEAARHKSPVLQARYSLVLIQALADPEANFSDEERKLLASVIEPDGTRSFTLRVRLSDAERIILQTRADELGISMSDYVRKMLFGE